MATEPIIRLDPPTGIPDYTHDVRRFYGALSTADWMIERGIGGELVPFSQARREIVRLRTLNIPSDVMAAVEADYAILASFYTEDENV